MKKSFIRRITDLTKVQNRAAFADVEQKIKQHKYGSDAFMNILQSRYSCHAFNHIPVSASKLEMILEAGRMAPSAANCQPVRIWVIKSEEALARLRKIHPCYGAPVVLVVGCRNEEAWVRESDGVIAAKTDAAIVLTHMMLTATDAGLAPRSGSTASTACWPSATRPPDRASPRNSTTSANPSRTWSRNCKAFLT